jgi:hypothetical protein
VKSSLSLSNGNCVEVASPPDGQVGIRHSKHTEGPVLRFTPDEWQAFLGGVRNGEFDSFGPEAGALISSSRHDATASLVLASLSRSALWSA